MLAARPPGLLPSGRTSRGAAPRRWLPIVPGARPVAPGALPATVGALLATPGAWPAAPGALHGPLGTSPSTSRGMASLPARLARVRDSAARALSRRADLRARERRII